MVGKSHKRLTLALLALLAVIPLSAQDKSGQKDSLIRLMKATSLQLIEEDGVNYRKAFDATFLHNGTYLICDTADWRVEDKVINAYGHVQILQDETALTSDKLDYYIDEDRAEFRGSVVELRNKEENVLRTRYLDYNTRDSVAVFQNGGSMKSKDGQVIESLEGTYDSKIKLFTFDRNVNMYTDTTFVKTEGLEYDSQRSRVVFTHYVDFWNDDNMMSANRGWYDRNTETFFFNDNVHATSKEQEVWTDTLYVFRAQKEVLLMGNAQVQDSVRNSAALADYILYQDTVSTVTLRKNAAVALITDPDTEKRDTIYLGADTLVYRSVRKCDIDPSELEAADTRIKNIHVDPVSEYRERAAKAAAEAASKAEADAAEKDPNKRVLKKKDGGEVMQAEEEPEGEQEAAEDTSVDEQDSEQVDSLIVAEPLDTTKLGFVQGISNVRIFRKDIQVHSDLMFYNDLDSIARFYNDPVVWNEGNRQYSSDSLYVLVSNGTVDRANLLSNAFIITQEDSLYFDQIKGAEVMAYFDSTAALRRFDALGGASAMFFLKENEQLATVNLVSSKMLSALLAGGEVDQVFYFDAPTNDAYPVAQLPRDMRLMKGFNWRNNMRPKGKEDITPLEMRTSERQEYAAHPRTVFDQTDIYFPGYMRALYRTLEQRDSIRRSPKPVEAEPVPAVTDSIGTTTVESIVETVPESTVTMSRDSMAVAVPDSVAVTDIADSAIIATVAGRVDSAAVAAGVAVVADSVAIPVVTMSEDSAAVSDTLMEVDTRSEWEIKRDERWAYLDSLDALKTKAKEEKALARKREKTRKQVLAQRRKEAREQKQLEKYIRKYEKQKAREEAARTKRVEMLMKKEN